MKQKRRVSLVAFTLEKARQDFLTFDFPDLLRRLGFDVPATKLLTDAADREMTHWAWA